MDQPLTIRNTRYTRPLVMVLLRHGHATNAELLDSLREEFPDLSATTVHRLTARLCSRGIIGAAPPDLHGSLRYDANPTEHDHFICSVCGNIRDIEVADNLAPLLEQALGGCRVSGRLVVHGTCNHCMRKRKELSP